MVHASDQTPMLVITQITPIAVLFTLPQDSLPAVAARMRQGTLPVDAYSRDGQVKIAGGKLLTIDNQIDPTTGTGRLKAVFENADRGLWPNQFVNVQLLLDTRKNALVVPAAAVQRGPQGTYAYVVKTDKTVENRPVEVDFTQNNQTALKSGLQPGEFVVTDGQDKLLAGKTQVEIRSGPGANPSAGSQGGPRGASGQGQGMGQGSGSGGHRRGGAQAADTGAR
jgi:multidrug efflux system membrane fusion protein